MKIALTALAVLAAAAAAYADGLLIEHGGRPIAGLYKIKYHRVTTTIKDQVAHTEIDQLFVNAADGDLEVSYLFPMPLDAAISDFEVWIDGKKLDGKVLPAAEARAVYADAARKKRDAALLEYAGLGAFQTSMMPFKKGEEKRVTIKYVEVLRAQSGMVRYRYSLGTTKFSAAPIEEVKISVSIESKDPLKNIYSPTHAVNAVRVDENHATAEWSAKNDVPRVDFDLFYGAQGGDVGAHLLSYKPEKDKPGYFLFFATPKAKIEAGEAEPKDIVFVLDKSGSMQEDNKIRQAREALKFVLRSLNPKDRFSIVTFNEKVDVYSPSLLDYGADEKQKALEFVDTINADGNTNIDGALKTSLGIFKDEKRVKMILFLTDGLPTEGEQDPAKISANAKGANTLNVRIFDFGVGHNVNTTLLDKLAGEHNGVSEYVKPGDNLEAAVSGFYRKIQSPVLSDLKLDFGSVKTRDLLPRKLPDLFTGGQIILAGRYDGAGKTTIKLTGAVRGGEQAFTYDVAFADAGESRDAFIERIWATRRVGDIIDQIQLYGQNDELTREIVDLGVRYGIVTEYTAFLAAEETNLNDAPANYKKAGENWKEMKDSGAKGFNQAQSKKAGQTASQAPATNTWLNEQGEQVEVRNCQTVAGKALFLKKKVWTDADITEKDEVVELKFWSDEFWKALDEKPALNAFASKNQSTAVKLDGKVYKLVKE